MIQKYAAVNEGYRKGGYTFIPYQFRILKTCNLFNTHFRFSPTTLPVTNIAKISKYADFGTTLPKIVFIWRLLKNLRGVDHVIILSGGKVATYLSIKYKQVAPVKQENLQFFNKRFIHNVTSNKEEKYSFY
jgi:hypothetical protein